MKKLQAAAGPRNGTPSAAAPPAGLASI